MKLVPLGIVSLSICLASCRSTSPNQAQSELATSTAKGYRFSSITLKAVSDDNQLIEGLDLEYALSSKRFHFVPPRSEGHRVLPGFFETVEKSGIIGTTGGDGSFTKAFSVNGQFNVTNIVIFAVQGRVKCPAGSNKREAFYDLGTFKTVKPGTTTGFATSGCDLEISHSVPNPDQLNLVCKSSETLAQIKKNMQTAVKEDCSE
jgi:hypothetical protein